MVRLRRRGGRSTVHRYGRRRTQVGELFLPAGPGRHPVAVVLHGGFWHAAYGRGLMADVCADLAANGVAAWNLEYRRVGGGGGWPATFEDVASGIDALAAMPDRYRLASPLERLPLGIPQLVVHGGRDRHVPAEVSERYAEVARAKGDEVDLAVLPEVGHMDLIDPRSPGWAVVREWLS